MPAPAATCPTWLITGASRGIGLQLVTELLAGDAAKAAVVIAAARTPDKAAGLQKLKSKHGDRLHLLQLDTAHPGSVQAAGRWIREHIGHLDILINNAGISEQNALDAWYNTGFEEATRILATNVTGPLLVTAALLPLLKASTGQRKIIGHVSSIMGSIGLTADEGHKLTQPWIAHYASGTKGSDGSLSRISAFDGGAIMYRASKAALNMEMLIMARDLAADNITVLSLHPGWTSTEMGNTFASTGSSPPVTPEQSARGLLHVLEGVSLKDAGSYLTWEGKTLPW